MEYNAGEYDICVVGAGHAGCEAALASSRLGKKTILFSITLDLVANMACNPSIGGTAKGHLVREVDALGGEIGKNTDKTFLQSKMLNTAKGPAVHSLRTQVDRRKYQEEMKHILEKQKNLHLKQAEVISLVVEKDKVVGVKTHTGAIFKSKMTILTTGTYLKSKIIIGDLIYEGGPDGTFGANKLSQSLKDNGIKLIRLKTGTPARINVNSVDLKKMEIQTGDEKVIPMSFENEEKDISINQIPCYLTYTDETTKQIITDNLHRSPLFSGEIKGVGPRYCPSIEDKIVRFKDKKRHQVFLEPMGANTDETYLQGMSSSLPEDVQVEMIKSIPGLKDFKMMRTAYAIEYDAIDPYYLNISLESKKIENLFSAGQINGSSGYEEAAAQGIIAGINAVNKIDEKKPLILDRSDAYIGVLIDDLVTKGTNEPYRMMTSRAEYRLLLRQDNADERLTKKGYEIGLISKERYVKYLEKYEKINKEIDRIKKTNIPPSKEVNDLLKKYSSTMIKSGIKLSELMKRPELGYEKLKEIDVKRCELKDYIKYAVEVRIKYEGYIKRQARQIKSFKKNEEKKIPDNIDYDDIKGLRIEACQKLKKITPISIGQASRISGVSPADINVLLIYMENYSKKDDKE